MVLSCAGFGYTSNDVTPSAGSITPLTLAMLISSMKMSLPPSLTNSNLTRTFDEASCVELNCTVSVLHCAAVGTNEVVLAVLTVASSAPDFEYRCTHVFPQ